MSVVVPWTSLHPETAAATRGARYVWVGQDDEAYWRLLARLWWEGRTFTVVEHDVVPPPGALAEMAACPADWCAVPYDVGDGLVTTALGCVKFGAGLVARRRDAVSAAPAGQRGWNGLDGVVIGGLHALGEVEHVHVPAAVHLRNSPTRRIVRMKLHYVGDGSRYLHEDYAAGIPPIPAADFETDDPVAIAVCLESNLYVEDTSGDTMPKKTRAKAGADAPAEAEPAAATAEA